MFSFFVQQHHVDLFYFFFIIVHNLHVLRISKIFVTREGSRGEHRERKCTGRRVGWISSWPPDTSYTVLTRRGVYEYCEYWGRCCCTMWSGCSCHVHYFAFKRSSKSKSPKALNEARERERKREKVRETGRFWSCLPWTFADFNTFYVQNKCELMHFY